MVLLKLLIFTLIFYGFVVHLDAIICPKGQKVNRNGNGCEDCRRGSYQPVENDSKQCMVCRKCDEESGSVVKEKCTKESDTKCECRGRFVRSDSDYSTCKCDIGFGLKLGECLECPDGYFSTSIDSSCQKWKECKTAGVRVNGTKTSDVICNESNAYVTTPTTSNKVVSLITHLISHRPHEGAQTQKMHTTTTTTSVPGPNITPKDKEQPSYTSNTGNHIGMVLLIFGIVGLLVLTTMTCRLHVAPYMERTPAVPENQSLCGRPVEESGNGSLPPLKPNPGEP